MGHVGAENVLPLTAANAASAAVSSVSLEILEAELDSNIRFDADCAPDSLAPALKASSPNSTKRATALEDTKASTEVEATWMPNPTEGRTSLQYDMKGNKGVRLSIRDMQGRKLKELPLEQRSGVKDVDLTSLRAGMYHYRITDEQGRVLKVDRLVLTK